MVSSVWGPVEQTFIVVDRSVGRAPFCCRYPLTSALRAGPRSLPRAVCLWILVSSFGSAQLLFLCLCVCVRAHMRVNVCRVCPRVVLVCVSVCVCLGGVHVCICVYFQQV